MDNDRTKLLVPDEVEMLRPPVFLVGNITFPKVKYNEVGPQRSNKTFGPFKTINMTFYAHSLLLN